MKKVLGVIGATGQQGGSVVDFVLNDPQLKDQYIVRAFTRDTSKPSAKALADKGCEVVQGDAEDPVSLQKGLVGVHSLFFMTALMPGAKVTEYDVGKGIADAAVKAGTQYLIFSTLPYAERISKGKQPVPHFDDKAKVEEYIRSLPVKSSFYSPGFFMQNFLTAMTPRPLPDGTLAFQCTQNGNTKIPMIDVVKDTGNYVGAILAQPEKYNGKVSFGASEYTSFEEVAKTMSKVYGKQVNYQQVQKKDYLTFLPEAARSDLISMFNYYDNFGYNGPNTDATFNEIDKSPRVPVTSLTDFLKNNPLTS
ncbi:hypothetical protein TRICI_001233 [Trichomonascus ciferrii]|uniref:NmrA-like domain-containing protein n=1 Tax=Trichomonascus ciferrii TaxID=44093 RepID=A0A642VAI5_9ASCO|nr:hypothetical protein TRICI_001233 [Trichomonascus ciferrii]